MYDRIYEYWRREKANPTLQSIDSNFYQDLSNYLGQLRECFAKTEEKTVKVKLGEGELERAGLLSKELLQLRLRKILQIAGSETSPDTISNAAVGEEKAILDSATEISKLYQSMIEGIFTGELKASLRSSNTGRPKRIVVRILTEMPAIVGADIKTYGPFKPEDVVSLPLENAEILVKGKAALKIDFE
jgi:DNA replication initiation complex subunit (GINS family)